MEVDVGLKKEMAFWKYARNVAAEGQPNAASLREPMVQTNHHEDLFRGHGLDTRIIYEPPSISKKLKISWGQFEKMDFNEH